MASSNQIIGKKFCSQAVEISILKNDIANLKTRLNNFVKIENGVLYFDSVEEKESE